MATRGNACLTIQTQRCASYQQQPEGTENDRMFLGTGLFCPGGSCTNGTWSYTSLGGRGGHEVPGGTRREVEAQKQKSKVSKKHCAA